MLEETHPYNNPAVIPPGTLALIVGSAPSPHVPGRDILFFYGSRRNQLWSKILPAVYNRQFNSAEDMKQFLKLSKIWMIDVLQTYVRRKPGSAKDNDLDPKDYTKFRPIFEKHPLIHTVIFTGAKAEKWAGEQWTREGILARPAEFWKNGKARMPRHQNLAMAMDNDQRQIEMYTLPSPSNAANKAIPLDEKIEMYRKILRGFPV